MITINLCLQRFINFSVDILFSGAYGNRKAQVYRKNPIIIENVLSSSGFLYTKYGTKFSWFGSWSLLLLHERMWYLFEFSFVEKTVRVKIFQYLSRYNKEARRLHAVVSWLQTLVPLVLDGVLSDLIFRQERFAFSMTASVSQSVAYKLQNTYAPEKSMSTEKLMKR